MLSVTRNVSVPSNVSKWPPLEAMLTKRKKLKTNKINFLLMLLWLGPATDTATTLTNTTLHYALPGLKIVLEIDMQSPSFIRRKI